ncbi:MAG: hypothetical protein E7404_09090 [Ruminococcaceae bacterium]|nr:hypothetical protein [Oscillospiraceae bacterium]
MGVVKCKIADFDIDFKSDIHHLKRIMRNFLSDSDTTDISVGIDEADVKYEMDIFEELDVRIYPTTFKISALFRKLSEQLPLHNAFVLHSACFDVDGVGVAFAAHSGTGKTTHMRLWQELLGERMTVVNGDKPIVRFFYDEPETAYSYGTPWNGKEGLGCNMRTHLQHICFIERSETNSCSPINKNEALNLILKQVYMPKNPQALLCTVQLIDRLLSCCKLWKINCNMEPQAAEVAYNAIFGK